MITYKRRRWISTLLVLAALAGLWWWVWPAAEAEAPAGAVAPSVGSDGTMFAPIASAQPQASANAPTEALPAPRARPRLAPDEEDLRLWPHLSQPAQTPERRAAVQAEWRRFAQTYPDNMFLPPSMQAKLTPEQARVEGLRVDNAMRMIRREAAQISARKNAEPGQAPPPAPAKPLDVAVQRDFYDFKIRELESLLQLGNYFLSHGQPSASERAEAEKDIQEWTRELESLRQVRSTLPSS
jgi:hypothetical protein